MAQITRQPAVDVGYVVKHGIIGGIIAGIAFAIVEMVLAALMGVPAVAPLQMIGAIALGPSVLPPATPIASTLIAGIVVHLILSAIYGVILALIALVIPALGTSVGLMTIVGMVYGLVLWLVNFYLIAPSTFGWFTTASPIVQFIAHVFFYGAILGYYLGTRLVRPAEVI